MDYESIPPWPTEPNGTGLTLCLRDPATDNSLADNWTASVEIGGTPGAVNFPPPAHPAFRVVAIRSDPLGGVGEEVLDLARLA